MKKIIFIFLRLFFSFINTLLSILRINFIELRGDKLGYLSFQQDILEYSKQKKRFKNFLFLFYNVEPVNSQLKSMWNKKVKKNKFLSWVKKKVNKNQSLGLKSVFLNLDIDPKENYHLYIDNSASPIKFTQNEEKKGQHLLSKMGLIENNFFCFNNRDVTQFKSKNIIKHYENESSHRNFPVEDLKKSVFYLIKQKIPAVFYGNQNQKLNWEEESIVDYPMLYKSDFLDIYLISKSKFFLGPNSGPMALSTLFRKPTIQVNVIPTLGTAGYFSKKDIFIPKKLFSIKENKYLSLRELISLGIKDYFTDEEFINNGIKIINNSPEEILNVTEEMLKNLDNNFENESEIEQTEFEKIIASFPELKGHNLPKISSSFIKNNTYFLN